MYTNFVKYVQFKIFLPCPSLKDDGVFQYFNLICLKQNISKMHFILHIFSHLLYFDIYDDSFHY